MSMEPVRPREVGEGARVGAGEESLRLVLWGGERLNRERGAEALEGGSSVSRGRAGRAFYKLKAAFCKEIFRWEEDELIGAMGILGAWDPELFGSEEGGELIESVGELVGVAQSLLKKIALGAGGLSGDRVESEGHDGRGGGEPVEVGLEDANQGGGIGRGLGNAEAGVVLLLIIEVEGQGEAGRHSLVGLQARGQGVEEVAQDEE